MSSVLTAGNIISEEEFSSYRKRVIALRENFILRGKGSRNNAAHDLRVALSRVGYLLTAKFYDLTLLERLEEWQRITPMPQELIAQEELEGNLVLLK
jgi:hypothetical protein